jgi:hypothetical protein
LGTIHLRPSQIHHLGSSAHEATANTERLAAPSDVSKKPPREAIRGNDYPVRFLFHIFSGGVRWFPFQQAANFFPGS